MICHKCLAARELKIVRIETRTVPVLESVVIVLPITGPRLQLVHRPSLTNTSSSSDMVMDGVYDDAEKTKVIFQGFFPEQGSFEERGHYMVVSTPMGSISLSMTW